MAGPTGLEPATSDVTGRRSSQLNYDPALERMKDEGGRMNLPIGFIPHLSSLILSKMGGIGFEPMAPAL